MTQPNEEMDIGEESEEPVLLCPRSRKVAEKGKGKDKAPPRQPGEIVLEEGAKLESGTLGAYFFHCSSRCVSKEC